MYPEDARQDGPERRQRAEEAIARRERFLHAVVAVQQTLLSGLAPPESDARVMRLLGEAVEVSRVYLFDAHPHPEDGRMVVTQRVEWCAPGVTSELNNPDTHNLDLAVRMPFFWRQLTAGQPVASTVADLPPEERAILEPQAIRSILVLPLVVGGRFAGLVGFDDCLRARHWDASLVDVLAAAAAALSLARERRLFEEARAREEAQRRDAEQARDAREADLRTLIEHLPDGIFLSVDGILRYVNPTAVRFLGASHADEVLGRRGLDFVHPEDRPIVERALEQVRRGLATSTGTFRYVQRSGQVRLAEAAMVPHAFGGQRAHAVIWRDVTSARQLQEQLLLADRMASMGTLAAGMAHEINNPLTYVLSNLEYVERQLERSGGNLAATMHRCAEALHEAREGAERVRRIVRQLKLFSRLEEETLGPVDPRGALEMAAAMAATEIRHRARLCWDCQPVPEVLADEGRLGQVLLNLVVNATQAIPEGQAEQHEIRLSTSRAPDGRVVLAVSDTGAGIPRELLTRIFDPFFTTKPLGLGTGLGLSISHSLVQAMGGEIQVESTPGRGSTFRVLLTAAPPLVAPAPGPGLPTVVPPIPRQRILVVDDDPGVARALTRLLAGHEVEVATGGAAARARLEVRDDWDLVLCDLMMPDLTGMDLFAWAEAHRPHLAPRFSFITGGAFTDRARAFAEQMSARLLFKPFSEEAVQALLRGMAAAA